MIFTWTLLFLCVVSFSAGFIDAIVGGGGLIQLPASILLLPQLPIATIIGTIKIPAFSGTSFAAYQYMQKQKAEWKILAPMMAIALVAAFAGSQLLTVVSNAFMKPLLLVILIFVAVYTYFKKDFGQHTDKGFPFQTKIIYAICISLIIGLYDGFVGPGTGSFLILALVSLLGYDFLHASAKAKMVNVATNFGSIVLFILKGKIIWGIALPMAFSNSCGGILGARFAIKKGNGFIRVFFLCIVTATLLRFAYDVFIAK
ncbi:sulfite exporter TauE/SafE family protein [Parasediminibacterium sp. JCM 36343]|uniref:sulfite exporter TauE/SafE family protein n=1 Tax=Parasediminibacterium sp. JCM 36343 TaxID=3374279 RepID=UPI00397D5B50